MSGGTCPRLLEDGTVISDHVSCHGAATGERVQGMRGQGTRTAVDDVAGVQVLQARRHLAGDVQHLGHVCPVILRALAAAQQPAVDSRLCGRARQSESRVQPFRLRNA